MKKLKDEKELVKKNDDDEYSLTEKGSELIRENIRNIPECEITHNHVLQLKKKLNQSD